MVKIENVGLVNMTPSLRPPNILFILSDQQRYDSLTCDGSSFAQTPNLDGLAKAGALFRQHIVASPVCSPSRASIWTGQYPSSHGVWANGCSLDESAKTTASHLATCGYQTAHFGKMHLVPILNRVASHPAFGFQTMEVAEGDQQYPPDDAYFNWLRAKEPMKFAELLEELYTNGQAKGYPSRLPRPLHQTEWTVDRCVDWLESEREPSKPFFLSAGFFDPHHAFNPLKEFWDLFEGVEFPTPPSFTGANSHPDQYASRHRGLTKFFEDPANLQSTIRGYHAMVSHLDACVGRLLRALETTGERDRTIVVFSSDHGELLGDFGMLWKGPFLLDSLMRVPLIVAGPGFPAGTQVTEPTASIDFFPTFAALAGAPIGGLPGCSWVSQAGTLKQLDSNRQIYAEWDAPDVTPSSCLRMLRTPSAKLIANPLVPAYGEFYDLENDPQETTNIWDPSDAKQLSMRQELVNRWHRPRPQTPCINGW